MSIQKVKEKIVKQAIVDLAWQDAARFRAENAAWLDVSFKISLAVLRTLRERKMSQKDLAKEMKCSPQYVNKLVRGSENMTLETICKLEKILGIKLIELPFQDTVHAG